MEITIKELTSDLENVLYDLDNGEIYSGIDYLRDIISDLKKGRIK